MKLLVPMSAGSSRFFLFALFRTSKLEFEYLMYLEHTNPGKFIHHSWSASSGQKTVYYLSGDQQHSFKPDGYHFCAATRTITLYEFAGNYALNLRFLI